MKTKQLLKKIIENQELIMRELSTMRQERRGYFVPHTRYPTPPKPIPVDTSTITYEIITGE